MLSINRGPPPGIMYPGLVQRPQRSAMPLNFHNNSRSTRYESYDLRDVFGHVVEFSGNQQGSRFLQTKLETANSHDKARLFDEIMPNARQLMQDIYGNYVIQKLFDHGDQMQKMKLADTMKGHVFALSKQPYGCRVVQKAFEKILLEQQIELASEITDSGNVINLVIDEQGNHVIQKVIQVMPSEHTGFIYLALSDHIIHYSTHAYGCRVIQRFLEKRNSTIQQFVLADLAELSADLIKDQFGNYVAQHIIEHGQAAHRQRIINLVLRDVKDFARHKFASNVVEKCIKYGNNQQRVAFLDCILGTEMNVSPHDNVSLLDYIKCSYGNYVLQSLLSTLECHEGQRLCAAIQPELAKAKYTPRVAKKTIEGIEREMARFLPLSSPVSVPELSDTPMTSRHSSIHSIMPDGELLFTFQRRSSSINNVNGLAAATANTDTHVFSILSRDSTTITTTTQPSLPSTTTTKKYDSPSLTSSVEPFFRYQNQAFSHSDISPPAPKAARLALLAGAPASPSSIFPPAAFKSAINPITKPITKPTTQPITQPITMPITQPATTPETLALAPAPVSFFPYNTGSSSYSPWNFPSRAASSRGEFSFSEANKRVFRRL